MNILHRVFQRAITKYEVNGDCHISKYSVGSHGYAQIGATEQGKNYVWLVHRVVWEFYHGSIPDNLTVDHICHVQKCINIRHLRLLPNKVNASDNGQIKTLPLAGKSCKRCGSDMVINANGWSICRVCANRRKREKRAICQM